MKELYRKFLYIPKCGKVPEKVMLVRIGIAIAFILMCLVAMSVSAYAFFTSTFTSAPSIIQSAVYQLEVVPNGFEEQDGVYTLTNSATDAVKTFDFTIKPTMQSNASVGYAKIIINDGEKELEIFTAPIWTNTENGPVFRNFGVDVYPNSTVTMQVISQWGSCSSETVAEGGLLVDLTYIAPIIEEEEEPQEDETTQEPDATPDAEKETEPEKEEQTPPDDTQTPPVGDDENNLNTPDPSTPPADAEDEEESADGEQPDDTDDGSQSEDATSDPVTE